MITRSAFPRHLIRSLVRLRSRIQQEWTINGAQGLRNLALDPTGLYGIRRRLARRAGSPLLQRWIDPTAPINAMLQEGKLSAAIDIARRRLGRIEQASPRELYRSRSAWTVLADILVLVGQREEAATIYGRIQEIAPEDLSAQWGLENLRRRFAPSPAAPAQLPVHFFTIVLNGMPFIERHIDELRKLPTEWHWHIVEGIAELIHDTKWSKARGGRADASLHRNGLSIDGTTDYLDRLAAAEPDRVTIYRPPDGQSWQGKLAMVRAPLTNIRAECLLWEIDVDEFWTAAQIQRMRQRFIDDPARSAAFFLCHYFIRNLVVTTANTYGNHIDFEWLRVWHFQPGDFWASHEPPRLCRRLGNSDIAVDIAGINPFAHGETLGDDLVFRHLAYVVPEQLRFKEIYYGYKNAVSQWENLPRSGPVRLRDHLDWITDEAAADDCQKFAIAPPDLKTPAVEGSQGPSTLFRSARTDIALNDFRNILIVKLDNIGDAVLLSPFLRELRANAPDARITLMVRDQVADIVALCPHVDRVVSVAVEAGGDGFRSSDAEFVAAYERKSFDLAIVPRRDTDEFGAGAIAQRSGARRVVGVSEGVSQTKARANRGFDQHYSDALLRVTPDHTVRQNLALLEFMNAAVRSDKLEAWIGPGDEARANALLSPIAGAEPLIAVCPGATHPGKIFPPELLLRILATFPPSWRFVLLGSAAERSLAETLQQGLGERAFTLCGNTSLREAMAVLRRCHAAIAMDSALAHFAAATGTPVAIFSMHPHHGGNDTLDQSPRRFGPWCAEDRRLVIQPERAWPGCENGCRWRSRGPHCIANIDLDAAADSLGAFLARHVSQ